MHNPNLGIFLLSLKLSLSVSTNGCYFQKQHEFMKFPFYKKLGATVSKSTNYS